jgi:hypothetical protein
MSKHGIPNGHMAERVGAALALTPEEHRCAHLGDSRYCAQCVTDALVEEHADQEAVE